MIAITHHCGLTKVIIDNTDRNWWPVPVGSWLRIWLGLGYRVRIRVRAPKYGRWWLQSHPNITATNLSATKAYSDIDVKSATKIHRNW